MTRKSESYDTEAERFLKSDIDVKPIIKGITDKDRALEYHKAAHKHSASKETKEAIAEKLREL